MLPTRHIVYVGCGLAGKVYSITSALERNHQPMPASDQAFRDAFQRFKLTRRGQPIVQLLVRASDRRAAVIDYDPRNPGDAAIREEIDQLAKADGLVVVLDSRLGREEANLEAVARLQRDLATRGVDVQAKPTVFQANKRDLTEIVTMDWVRGHFRATKCSYVESSALNHTGTLEAMREVLRLTGAIE